MKVAFVGTGMMGGRMAGRLLDAGHEVSVYNRTRERTSSLARRGAVVADTPRAAAEGAEALISILADPEAVWATALGDEGFLAGLGRGGLWVDMSTLSPAASRELAAAARGFGVRMLDAPVSGSLGAADKGTLVILVGGAAEDVAAAAPLFDVLGRSAIHLGPSGAGSIAKLAVNVFLLAAMVAGAEALRLAVAEGLDRTKLLHALRRTEIMPAWTLGKLEALDMGETRTAFSLALAVKDLTLVHETARSAGVELPLAEAVRAIYSSALAAGLGEHDFSAVEGRETADD
jgi:3-hydroxyisobutyrate dehydrogenase